MHLCDNRKCCNPLHLAAGTSQANMDDKMRKGRHRALVGEAHPNARLKVADVVAIRQRVADGESKASVARAFQTTRINVRQICSREAWGHVP